jgi:regulator of sirC expression with transglutaminase-like and TPR domain
MALHPSYLVPVDCHTITIRMLANLKSAHRRRGDYARAMLACDHLVELTQAPEHRRDRGLLAHALQTYGAASEDLAAYLEARPDAKDAQIISLALEEALEQADLVLH